MKYKFFVLYIFLFFILTSCADITKITTKKTKNGNICWREQNFQILQGLEDGALAYECPWPYEKCWRGQIVYLVDNAGIDFYDGQNIQSLTEQCWVRDGVYRYENTKNIPKSVPLLYLDELESK